VRRSPATRIAIALPERPSPGSPVLTAEGVVVRREGRAVLDRAELIVHAGELVALVGPNGAGKSTLLGVLAGDIAPESGEANLLGRPFPEWTIAALARQRSVLLQDNQVAFPFTVREVVQMGRAPWRGTVREQEDEQAVQESMLQADVAALAPRRVPSLSGGERARVGFARTLASRTGALLLDEPTAALDIAHQESVLRLAREHADRGDAVVVVLHELNLAAAYADRVVLLRAGRIVASGTPSEVLTAQRVSEVYEHPVEIIAHPRTGRPVIVPVR